jgi:plasmid maintenance system antidote protein VapI
VAAHGARQCALTVGPIYLLAMMRGQQQERGSANMTIRLDKAFGGGAETWLRL